MKSAWTAGTTPRRLTFHIRRICRLVMPGLRLSGARVSILPVDRLDAVERRRRQCQVDAGDIGLELVQRGGADDVGGDERAAVDEGQRYLRRIESVFARQLDVGLGGGDAARRAGALEDFEER